MMSEKAKTTKKNKEVIPEKTNKSEKVWRTVAIISIVVVIGLLAAGFIKWDSYHKQIDELQSKLNAKSSQTTEVQSSPVNDSQEATATAVVVKVPEAGIQFGVPNGYPAITYKNNGDGTFAIIAKETINPGSMCQAQDGSVGALVGNTKERLESLGDDPDSGEFGTLANGKYWTVATGGVCDNNNSNNRVNQLLNYIKGHISEL